MMYREIRLKIQIEILRIQRIVYLFTLYNISLPVYILFLQLFVDWKPTFLIFQHLITFL